MYRIIVYPPPLPAHAAWGAARPRAPGGSCSFSYAPRAAALPGSHAARSAKSPGGAKDCQWDSECFAFTIPLAVAGRAPGIVAESPQARRRRAEDLERKARFLARSAKKALKP
jgi:hypothetical protein